MQGIEQMITGASRMANSGTTVANGLTRVRASVNGTANSAATTAPTTSTTTTTGTDGSTITANDFLTLLVTEMKNQDPTQPTDPNAYIQQLVQVNSLQQLIGINQGISSLDSAATTPTTSTSSVSG